MDRCAVVQVVAGLEVDSHAERVNPVSAVSAAIEAYACAVYKPRIRKCVEFTYLGVRFEFGIVEVIVVMVVGV